MSGLLVLEDSLALFGWLLARAGGWSAGLNALIKRPPRLGVKTFSPVRHLHIAHWDGRERTSTPITSRPSRNDAAACSSSPVAIPEPCLPAVRLAGQAQGS